MQGAGVKENQRNNITANGFIVLALIYQNMTLALLCQMTSWYPLDIVYCLSPVSWDCYCVFYRAQTGWVAPCVIEHNLIRIRYDYLLADIIAPPLLLFICNFLLNSILYIPIWLQQLIKIRTSCRWQIITSLKLKTLEK